MPKTEASWTRTRSAGEKPSSRVVARASTVSGISSRAPLSLAAISSTTKRALPCARSSRSVIIPASIALPAGVARARGTASVVFAAADRPEVPLTETSGPWLVADSNQGRCRALLASVPKRSSEASSADWVCSRTISCGAVIVAWRKAATASWARARRNDGTISSLSGRCDIGGERSGDQGQPGRQLGSSASHQVRQRLAHLRPGKVQAQA